MVGLREDQIAVSGITYANWLIEVQVMKDWTMVRVQFLDSQYESKSTHSSETREFVVSVDLTVSPSDGGIVYHTTDGSNPRAWGELSPPLPLGPAKEFFRVVPHLGSKGGESKA